MVALLWSDAKLINGRLRVKDDVPGHQIVLSSLSAAYGMKPVSRLRSTRAASPWA